ncbi:hypothetical protein [Cupriavidus necator]
MTADQAVERQAAQECRANKALQLLEALATEHAYIEVGNFTIGREEVEMVGGGGSDVMWVTTKYIAGRADEREAFDTLADAVAKALRQ